MKEIQLTYKNGSWEILVIEDSKIVAGYWRDPSTSKLINKRADLKIDYLSLPQPSPAYAYAEFWKDDPCVVEIEAMLKDAYPDYKIKWME